MHVDTYYTEMSCNFKQIRTKNSYVLWEKREWYHKVLTLSSTLIVTVRINETKKQKQNIIHEYNKTITFVIAFDLFCEIFRNIGREIKAIATFYSYESLRRIDKRTQVPTTTIGALKKTRRDVNDP